MGERSRGVLLRSLLAMASVCIVLGGVRAASSIVTQLLSVTFLTVVLSPVYYFLRRRRVPEWMAVTVTICLLVGGVLYGVGVLLPSAVLDFSRNAQLYHRELVTAADDLTAWLIANDIGIPRRLLPDLVAIDAQQLASFGKRAIPLIGGFVKNSVYLVIVVSFLIAELPAFPKAMVRSRWMTPGRRDLVTGFVRDVRHYLGVKALISAGTGLSLYIGLRILCVDAAGLLGTAAFFLNFVPVFGSILAAAPAILLALSGGGIETACWTALLYLVVNQILGNILEPRVMGRGFGVSPVIVLLSVLFWGWLLGPYGMLFAVPLTMAVRSALRTESEP